MPAQGLRHAASRASRGLSRALLVLGVAAAVVVPTAAPAGVWPPWAAEDRREPAYPDVSTSVVELAERLGRRDLVVVDARSRGAYLSGHVPGAISIPASEIPNPPEGAVALAGHGLTGGEEVVCYGETSDSVDAARLFWLLDAAGAARVSILSGGATGWSDAGRDLEREERWLPPAAWAAERRPDRVARTELVAQSFGEEGTEIIDARGWDAWEGEDDGADAEDPASRTGHVPHALPFDFRELTLPDHGLLPAEEARGILAAFGPRPSTPVDLWGSFIVYDDGLSGKGALGYFLLRMSGVEAVRYYPGGWNAWVADPSLPVVRIIHAKELKARLTGARRWFRPNAPPSTFALFDVRHRHDFEDGHIPGAVNLNSRVFADSLDAYIERYWPHLDRSVAPIVTYCYGTNCIRSRNCATVAAREGFLSVLRLYGGVDEWRDSGGRLVSGR